MERPGWHEDSRLLAASRIRTALSLADQSGRVLLRCAWAVDSLGDNSRYAERVALAGADVVDPEENLPRMTVEFNRQGNEPLKLRFGVPTDFESIVAQRDDRPVIAGELNPVFQGIYSSRIELKQWMRRVERTLTTAE